MWRFVMYLYSIVRVKMVIKELVIFVMKKFISYIWKRESNFCFIWDLIEVKMFLKCDFFG